MKDVDLSGITSRPSVRLLHPIIDDSTIGVSEVVVSLYYSFIRKVEIGNLLEI